MVSITMILLVGIFLHSIDCGLTFSYSGIQSPPSVLNQESFIHNIARYYTPTKHHISSHSRTEPGIDYSVSNL